MNTYNTIGIFYASTGLPRNVRNYIHLGNIIDISCTACRLRITKSRTKTTNAPGMNAYAALGGLAATILATKLSISEVRDILRHAQVSTTDKYIRSLGVTKDRLNEAFKTKKATLEVDASKVA